MYSEEETFNKLRRLEFKEVFELHKRWYYRASVNFNRSERIPFMKTHGWTWLEFVLEAKKRGIGHRV